eukprot:6889676-Lingulodinium_polyedra.AAC.1
MASGVGRMLALLPRAPAFQTRGSMMLWNAWVANRQSGGRRAAPAEAWARVYARRRARARFSAFCAPPRSN